MRVLSSFAIGGVTIDPPLTLAPMAGQTNQAFRRLCRENGCCGLVCTELISSQALKHRSSRSRTMAMFDWSALEAPLAVQLFGSDPDQMADAARLVADRGADIVDINLGCWVPKVARKRGGAALLRDLPLAVRVVQAVVAAVDIPVTVKVRSGFEHGEVTAVEFARAAEDCGVQAVAVHARTAAQGFSGAADWTVIRRVKAALRTIPVIGNGDVDSPSEIQRMFRETGCDGVMVGRAALGAPWFFRRAAEELATGRRSLLPDLPTRAAAALRHARLAVETSALPEWLVFRELRGQLSRYRLDQSGERTVRDRLVRISSWRELEEALSPLLQVSTASSSR